MAQWYVKEFAKLTGVTVRTLHHYDKIGLLKPSIRLSNGYRSYSEADLLKVQQIIALKFLGFDLEEIKKIQNESTNVLQHLFIQKDILIYKSIQLKNAIRTIETIISELENRKSIVWNTITQLIEEYRMMSDTKMQWGFNTEKQREYQRDLIAKGVVTEEQVENLSKKKTSVKDAQKMLENQTKIHLALAKAISDGLLPESPQVQKVMKNYRSHLEKYFWAQTRESFLALAEFNLKDKDARKALKEVHSKLPEFLFNAMKAFAKVEWK